MVVSFSPDSRSRDIARARAKSRKRESGENETRGMEMPTLPQSSYESYHPHSSASAEPLPTKTIDYYHQSLAQSQSYKEPIHPPGTSRTENQPLLKTPQGQKRNYSHCYRPLSPVWRGSMWGKIHRALGGITPHPTPINDKKYHTQD
ncbi:uncharacterized protein LOC134280125 [Saccostrea cucullata]|uniref:uncharacterized protein LOC134280125 n=1 Tax=Saccostrea cuccullata TaxID=36930 RepID=UPI002ED31DDC